MRMREMRGVVTKGLKLGSTIRQIRTKRGLTQAEAAKRARMSGSYWALIEQGLRKPNLAVVEDIAGALGVPVTILVFLASDMNELETVDRGLAERLALLSWKLMESDGAISEAEGAAHPSSV